MNIPEGWKLVPVEPTPAMCKAANGLNTNRNRYDAMLAAAPVPPQADAQPVVLPEKKYPSDWNKAALRSCNMEYMDGYNEAIDDVAKLGALYTRADAGEVMTYDKHIAQGAVQRCIDLEKERDTLRAQLAERDALLKTASPYINGGFGTVCGVWQERYAALSASAEPGDGKP